MRGAQINDRAVLTTDILTPREGPWPCRHQERRRLSTGDRPLRLGIAGAASG